MSAAPSPTFEEWKREGRTFAHGPHSIFYRDQGSGPVLLAIHGFPSASWDWHPMWTELTSRFRVIAPDMLGFGWSAKPRDHHYSLVDQATLHENLVAQLGASRVHVLAHDYGDTVAQELLARHDERAAKVTPGLALESICFLNGGLLPEQHRPRTVQKILAGPLGPLVGRLTSRRSLGSGLVAVFGPATPPSPQFVDQLWTLLSNNQGQRVLHLLIGYMAERRQLRERWVQPLLNTTVPFRLVVGAADPVSGSHVVAGLRALKPTLDAAELPDIGHYPQVEDPAGVLREFLAFHTRLGTLAAAAS